MKVVSFSQSDLPSWGPGIKSPPQKQMTLPLIPNKILNNKDLKIYFWYKYYIFTKLLQNALFEDIFKSFMLENRNLTFEKRFFAYPIISDKKIFRTDFGFDAYIDCDFSDLEFIDFQFVWICNFYNVRFTRSTFTNSWRSNAGPVFINCDLSGVSIRDSCIEDCEFINVDMQGSQLINTTFENNYFFCVNTDNLLLSGVKFTWSDLYKSYFNECYFSDCIHHTKSEDIHKLLLRNAGKNILTEDALKKFILNDNPLDNN
jgi:uncharacterized protein YjbI with pentapeptide repeats